MSRVERLDVFYGEAVVGHIQDASPLQFEYAPAWLAQDGRMALGAIPLQAGVQDSPQVQAFFENLLPEGELRQYIAEHKKASSLFAMLRETAGDTAGAFVILPSGAHPGPPQYEPSSWQALARALKKKTVAAIGLQGAGARISLAGAQDKATLAIFDDGIPRLPRGTAPSTHILKPDIRRLEQVWHSAVNETIVMKTAAYCGLPTAEVFFEPHTRSCIVRRFDRVPRADGTLTRLVQYDLCQLAGVMPEKKYEKEGGPGAARCAALIRQYSSAPAQDLRLFLQWIFFNLYTGNNDSHAKNLSLYWQPGQGVRLTPFYDLMCTRLYPGLSQEFAFSIGGVDKPGKITRQEVTLLAAELGFGLPFVLRTARELADTMPAAVAQAVQELMPTLTPGEKTLAGRIQRFVNSTSKQTVKRMLG